MIFHDDYSLIRNEQFYLFKIELFITHYFSNDFLKRLLEEIAKLNPVFPLQDNPLQEEMTKELPVISKTDGFTIQVNNNIEIGRKRDEEAAVAARDDISFQKIKILKGKETLKSDYIPVGPYEIIKNLYKNNLK